MKAALTHFEGLVGKKVRDLEEEKSCQYECVRGCEIFPQTCARSPGAGYLRAGILASNNTRNAAS